jgi:phosphatidylglycerol lysyltransferase
MLASWPSDVRRARDLVIAHGWNATAYQIVNPGIQHWFSPKGDAVVGFVEYTGFRVVAGAPVCSLERLPAVVEEFEGDATESGRRVCYFGAEARLDSTLAHSANHSRALLGAQPAWNPTNWDESIRKHKSLRAQLNRARNKGIRIVEYPAQEAMTSADLRSVLSRWLKTRGLPPLHFLVEPDTLERLDDRRIFVARHEDPMAEEPVVAFAVLSPVPARDGWLIEQFPRLPVAPNGTIELLLSTAVGTVAESGAKYVTLGLAPLARRSAIEKEGEPWWLRAALNLAAFHGNRFYNFRGLEAFKTKFYPEVWEPVYAIQNSPAFSPGALLAIARAFVAL